MTDQSDVLAGIRVLDVASFIAGPAAATVMADFGAEVIKVEPLTGDPYRQLHKMPGLPSAPINFPWLVDNRNKRSIALALDRPEGREVLRRMIAETDVFVTNFIVPARQKLKLTYEDVKAVNDQVIYASMTAYGESGPEAARTGFDSTAHWARCGMMDLVRPSPDSPPARSLPGMGDHPTAIALFGAIMLGLWERSRTGKGSKVSTSLLATGLWANAFYGQAALCGIDIPPRPGPDQAPNALTNHYRCRDDRWLIIAMVQEEREWENLVAAMDRPEWLSDDRFVDKPARLANAPALLALMIEAFAARDFDHWVETLKKYRVTHSPVAKVTDFAQDEQMRASGALMLAGDAGDGAELMIDSPIWLEGAKKQSPRRAPEIGEHSAEILTQFGYEDSEIDALSADGVVGLSAPAN